MSGFEMIQIMPSKLSEEEIDNELYNQRNVFNFDFRDFEQEKWGIKKLAYPIKEHKDGYYVLQRFKVDNSNGEIEKMEEILKNRNNVIKFIIVRTDC